MKKEITLHELTGQNMGIIIFDIAPEKKEAMILEWFDNKGLPRFFVDEVYFMPFPDDVKITSVQGKRVKIEDLISRKEIIYDATHGIADITGNATAYNIAAGITVLAPKGWR